jgi:hypothetical protein
MAELTEAQKSAVARSDVPARVVTLAGARIPVFFEWQPAEEVRAQLLALLEDEVTSWPSCDGALSLGKLVGIRVHENWEIALKHAEHDVGSLPGSTLSAKHPAAVKHGRYGSELLLNRNLVEGALISQLEWTQPQMRAVLRHELAHVQDRTRLDGLFPPRWLTTYRNPREKLCLSLGLTFWEEYYADRKASEYEPLDPIRVDEKDAHLEKALGAWRVLTNDEQVRDLFQQQLRIINLVETVRRVCQNLGYALGLRVSGRLGPLPALVRGQLTMLGWETYLTALTSSLDELFHQQSWSGREVLEELGASLLQMSETRGQIWTEAVLREFGSGCTFTDDADRSWPLA